MFSLACHGGSFAELYDKTNIPPGLTGYELNSQPDASYLVAYMSAHIRFNLDDNCHSSYVSPMDDRPPPPNSSSFRKWLEMESSNLIR